jgi:hypothetical protein
MFQVSSEFSWVKGPAVVAAEYHGDLAILSHAGGGAFSIVRGTEYLACCPSIDYARAFVERQLQKVVA